jgi:hypothetical protein
MKHGGIGADCTCLIMPADGGPTDASAADGSANTRLEWQCAL